jgi:hypothetical protein
MKTLDVVGHAHTAGPWKDSHNGRDDIRIFAESVADSPRCVAKINTPHNRSLEACANARLIAASPELWAIARQYRLELENAGMTDGPVYRTVCAVLDKAEGKA